MNTHKAFAAAPQACIEHMWRRGGEPHTDIRGRSYPPRILVSLTPDRDAAEQKRMQEGPEYPIQRLSTTRMPATVPHQLTNPPQAKPQSTVTASYDGLVGLASPELVVLANPRSIRCLYRNKDFRCLTKKKLCFAPPTVKRNPYRTASALDPSGTIIHLAAKL